MICKNCSMEIPGDSAFCPGCGMKAEKVKLAKGNPKKKIQTIAVILVAVVALIITAIIDMRYVKINGETYDKWSEELYIHIYGEADLETIKEFKKLKELSLIDEDVMENLDFLSEMTWVEEFTLYGGEHLTDINGIAYLEQLREFWLFFPGAVVIDDLSMFEGKANLEVLWIEIPNEYEGKITLDLSPLRGCNNLKFLRLSFYQKLINLDALADKANLQDLTMWSCGLNDISFLDKFTSMEYLCLYGNNISDFSPLQGCVLGSLDVRYNPIPNVEAFNGITVTDELDISGCGFTDAEAEEIKKLVGGTCEVINE